MSGESFQARHASAEEFQGRRSGAGRDARRQAVRLLAHQFDFSGKTKMGSVYKAPADLAAYRNLERLKSGISPEIIATHLLRAGGGDAVARNPRFLRNTIDFMDKHADVEQVRSQSVYPAEVAKKFPLFHATTVFARSMRAFHTRGKSNLGLGTFRARIYAEAGGFNPEKEIAEEVALGQAIRRAGQKKGEGTIRKLLVKNAVDNPRRELFAFLEGREIRKAHNAYGNKSAEERLQKFDWEKLIQSKWLKNEYRENSELNAKNTNREFDSYFQFYSKIQVPRSNFIREIVQNGSVDMENPETRMLMRDKRIKELVAEIERRRGSGEEIIINDLAKLDARVAELSECVAKRYAERTLSFVFQLEKGKDYEWVTDAEGRLHFSMKKEGVKKMGEMSQKKWENFKGYWPED